MKDVSVPQNKTTKTKERRRERPRQRKREPERQRQIEREKHTKRQRGTKRGVEGEEEETRMNNDNETNTVAPLWPCLWKDSCYENVAQSNIILTNVRSLGQYGLSAAYFNISHV